MTVSCLWKKIGIVAYSAVAAVKFNCFSENFESASRRNSFFRHLGAFFMSSLSCKFKHIRGKFNANSVKPALRSALQYINGFANFNCISYGAAQRLIHISHDCAAFFTCRFRCLFHNCSELFRFFTSFHECARSPFNVKKNTVGIDCKLFAHNAGADQRNAVNSSGCITQRVYFFIGRTKTSALRNHGKSRLIYDIQEFIEIQFGTIAVYAL